jgi:hypothetical protein
MALIAVYRFTCWEQDTVNSTACSRFATLKAIRMRDGRNIEETRRLVDSSELDTDGFYQPPAMRKAAS